MLATRRPRVYSTDYLNGKKISEQYKQGVQHGSVAGCQEILGHSGTFKKNLLCSEAWETILGRGREPREV